LDPPSYFFDLITKLRVDRKEKKLVLLPWELRYLKFAKKALGACPAEGSQISMSQGRCSVIVLLSFCLLSTAHRKVGKN